MTGPCSGGDACQDTGDTLQAWGTGQGGGKGAAAVVGGGPRRRRRRILPRSADVIWLRRTRPEEDKYSPGHDAAAAMLR